MTTTTTTSSVSVLSNNLLLARQQQQRRRRNGVIITRRRKCNSGVRIQSALFSGGGQGLKKTPEQKNKLKRLEKLNPGNNEQEEEFWPEDLKQLRTPIMAGNWKCNPKTLEEARTLASLVAANTAEDRRDADFFNNNNERGGGGRSGFNLFNKRNANNNRGGGRGDNKNVEVLICPPAAFLSEVSQLVRFLIYRFFSRGSTQRVTEKRARVKILVPLLRIEAGSNYLLLLKRYFSCHSYSDSLLL